MLTFRQISKDYALDQALTELEAIKHSLFNMPVLFVCALLTFLWLLLPVKMEPVAFTKQNPEKIKFGKVSAINLVTQVIEPGVNQIAVVEPQNQNQENTVFNEPGFKDENGFDIQISQKNKLDFSVIDKSIATKGEVVYSNDFDEDFDQWIGDKSIWQMGAPVYGPTDLCANDSMCIGTLLDQPYPDDEPALLSSPAIDIPITEPGEEIQLTLSNWFEIDRHDQIHISISHAIGEDAWTDPELLLAQSGQSREWENIEINLSEYVGQSIKLHFELVQNIEKKGSGSGWYIDDLQISKTRNFRKQEAL